MAKAGIMDRRGSRAKAQAATAGARAALALVLALAGCKAQEPRTVASHVGEIEARSRQLEEAFRAGNLLGVADAYADDAVLLGARGERTAGRDEIDAFWSAVESPVAWRLEIRRIHGSEALAYALGTSRLTTQKDGALVTTVSDFLWLWRREPDGWRIALDVSWPRVAR
jgi:uncharacterized protein (TIGR02246 family)